MCEVRHINTVAMLAVVWPPEGHAGIGTAAWNPAKAACLWFGLKCGG